MMSRLFLAAVLSGGVTPLLAAEDTKTLGLRWRDPHELLGNFERARREADDIFDRLGVSVCWGTTPEPAGSVELLIQVVLMPSEPSGWKLAKNVMGAVLFPDRRQQETVYLFYPAILRSVGLGNRSGTLLKPRERKDVARAVGRVLVHEVVHAVAPSFGHADSGLMHDALSAGALSRRHVKVDERSRRAFLQGLALFERTHSAALAPRE